MSDPAVSLSVVSLFMHADIVVKGVLVLLLAASVWSWAVIIDKLWRLAAASRSAQAHEARVAAANSAPDLMAPSGRPDGGGTRRRRAVGGLDRERRSCAGAAPETLGERRERIERAMRLALGAELRRLEARLPFLGDLGLGRTLHRAVRHGVGDHAQLHRHRRRQQHQPRGGGAGHRRGFVRDRDGARRGDPGGRRLQQDHRRPRTLCRAHERPDRALAASILSRIPSET